MNRVSAAEYGRIRLSACPLERQLNYKHASSASRLHAARYGGDTGEIWGDLPLLGRPAVRPLVPHLARVRVRDERAGRAGADGAEEGGGEERRRAVDTDRLDLARR